MAQKVASARVQDLVYHLEVGVGLSFMRRSLYVIGVLVVLLLYTASQFHGLREAEAMESAQLGRNLTVYKNFVTHCVRPASMGYLDAKGKPSGVAYHPDLLNPPVYPIALAALFKATGLSLMPEAGQPIFKPEQWILVPFGHLCTVLTGWLVYLIGLRLFDRRIALLGVSGFFLSDIVWHYSVSGLSLPLVTLLVTASVYGALLATAWKEENRRAWTWIVALLASALCGGLAVLTRYGALVFIPGIAIFLAVGLGARRGRWTLIYLAVVLAVLAPWLARNIAVSGNPFGMALISALNETTAFEGNLFDASLKPSYTSAFRLLQTKWMTNAASFYGDHLRTLGNGLVTALFLTTFFYRFVRRPIHVLRWCLALSFLLMFLIAPVFGESGMRLIHLFWPFALLYGMAFFVILLDRIQFKFKLFQAGAVAAFLFLLALPLIFTLLPPRTSYPYPPYFSPFISHVCRMMRPDEVICTDMPWATAWYGNRMSVLLPANVNEFYDINDYRQPIKGLYFTTITRDKPFVRGLMTGPYKTWFPILEGRIPADFPLNQGFPLSNMDQLFLTDRPRWSE